MAAEFLKLQKQFMPMLHYVPLILLISAIVFFSIRANKLTVTGAITGGMIAILVFVGAGYTGIAMLGAFFVLGTLATVWKRKEKRQFKATEDQTTKRNAGQVLANGGVAALIGVLIYFLPSKTELLRLMMAASFASAMADTLSSELGMIYGRRFYNIISWKKDRPGLDGVISLEGTVIGLGGSVLIAVIYSLGFGWSSALFLFIVIAGAIGNLSDSILGATLERKHYIGNDLVNFLNTLIAALVMYVCSLVW